jgi:hypothetical protein
MLVGMGMLTALTILAIRGNSPPYTTLPLMSAGLLALVDIV